MLLPSVLGFALCFVCLAATTWAWFVVSVTSEANTIKTASFDVNVAVTPIDAGTVTVEDSVYKLSAGTKYTVTLTKTGTASKGYCAVTIDGSDYYTQQITSNEYTFTLNVTGTGTTSVTFTPFWGDAPAITTYSLRAPADVIVDGATIEIVGNGEETAEESAEDPANETQQEDEQENQQQEEENPSDEQESTDDPENNGEGENTSTDTPAEGEGGQQGDEQQPSEPSTPTDGEQGGETPDVSGETTGGDIGDDTTTGDDTSTDTTTTAGGETPTDTPTPAGGDVSTDPVATTDPAPTE